MRSIVLCHAPADAPTARRLADFLELNLPFSVSLDEALVTPEVDLLEAAERALSAEVALVFLSPSSVPRVWDRKLWTSVFLEMPKELLTQVGFVLVRECRFPDLLLRERFFDAAAGELTAFRQLKRWLLRPVEAPRAAMPVDPDLEPLLRSVSDRPGIGLTASPGDAARFAHVCASDFEAVYVLDCHGRSRAGILGEIGSALGLRLPGRPEQNRLDLAAWCADRRVLFVFTGVEPEDRGFAAPGGRASAIFTTGSLPDAFVSPAAQAVRLFEAGRTLRSGWAAVALLKQGDRLAETIEVLNVMAQQARRQEDAQALTRIEREQYWIRDDLDYEGPVLALRIDPAQGGQLSFAF